jgi:hypothetical protein
MATHLYKPYCTVEEVQGMIGNNDPSLLDLLADAINQASRLVDETCGRDFWFHDHEDTGYQVPRSGVCGRVILLPFEVITLTEVTLDGSVTDMSTVSYEAGSMAVFGQTDWGALPFLGTIVVKGTFGFSVAPLNTLTTPPTNHPSSIRRATLLTAAALSGEWRKERVGLDGDRQSILETRIPPEANTLLTPFKIRSRAVGF